MEFFRRYCLPDNPGQNISLIALALEDEMVEGSIFSPIVESLQFIQSGDGFSPKDLAWIDSCLIKDAEISDSGWNSLKDALLEIVRTEPLSIFHSAAESGASPTETDIMIHTPSKEAETFQFRATNNVDDDVVPVFVESETNSDGFPVKQNNSVSLPQTFQGYDASEIFVADPFLPRYKVGKEIYKDGKRGNETIGSGLDLYSFSEDIFKVWDLGVSAEEVELFTQLNKALSETVFQSTPSALMIWEHGRTWKIHSIT